MQKSVKNKDCQVVYTSVEENCNSLLLQGKCGKFDFEVNISFEQFPSEKMRDKAYRVWAETFLGAVVGNGRKVDFL